PGEAVPQFENFRVAFGTPQLAFLLLMFFAINLGFTNLESTYFQLLADPRAVFRLDVDEAKKVGAIVLALVGVLGAFTQGYLVRRLMPVFGEVKLVRAAYFVMTPTFLLVPVAALWFPGILLILLMGVASGLAQPCLSSLISRNAPPRMQGGIFGITQSLGATARLLGPLISNTTFAWRPQLPYIIGAAIIAFPAMGAWRLRQPPLEETAIGDAALTIA
ncbi:MAG: MFS transporter, partial [Fimbriimonas ginsengisoli]|nr:MFS transporter [Fimbriimonas ginsengisoli]